MFPENLRTAMYAQSGKQIFELDFSKFDNNKHFFHNKLISKITVALAHNLYKIIVYVSIRDRLLIYQIHVI